MRKVVGVAVVVALLIIASVLAFLLREHQRMMKYRATRQACGSVCDALFEYVSSGKDLPIITDGSAKRLPDLIGHEYTRNTEWLDGWGNEIQVTAVGQNWVVWSRGADGRDDVDRLPGANNDPDADTIYITDRLWSWTWSPSPFERAFSVKAGGRSGDPFAEMSAAIERARDRSDN